MDFCRRIWNYLNNLEWKEKKQLECVFCDQTKLHSVVYEDDHLLVIDSIHPAGRTHWLMLPKVTQTATGRHIRDVEALTAADLPLLHRMQTLKTHLLKTHYPTTPASAIHTGYHRGRRHLLGPLILPDIISVHHLHLHIIIEPWWLTRYFKYPTWFRPMWISDEKVLRETAGRTEPRMKVQRKGS